MLIERRSFLCTLASAAAVAANAYPLRLFAESTGGNADGTASILIDARGKYRPVALSPLHLGAARQSADGEESLGLTTHYLQRSPAPGVAPEPILPVAGEFHYARFPSESWEDELRKMKAGGVTVVSTYVFWILHERVEGAFDWTGRRDLRRFIELCGKIGLDIVVRIGPFAHGEMRNGGLPDWLYAKPVAVRSNDPVYLEYVRRLYAQIAGQCKGLLYQQGGPVIAVQVENEFMAATSPWEIAAFRDEPVEWIPQGSGGPEHLLRLKQLAVECGLDAPLVTATAWGPPLPANEFLPMFGGYGFEPWSVNAVTHEQPPSFSFLFADSQVKLQPDGKRGNGEGRGTVPFACCELGGGMQCFYKARFVVPPECAQGIAVASLGSGAAWLGYYMFHGGSNPSGEPIFYNEYDVPHISYDFQAPLREYGQVAPAYRMLRPIHIFLGTYGQQLARMQTTLPARAESLTPACRDAVRCAIRSLSNAGFLFLNNYQDHVELPARTDLRFQLTLDNAEISIPERGSVGIAANEAAILPFGLRVGFVTLRYATAQLITQVSDGSGLHVFFFAPHGMVPELCLDATGIDHTEAEDAHIERGPQIIAHGEANRAFVVHCRSGNQSVHFYVLTREDSLRLSCHTLWGEERIVFSDADIAEVDGDLLAWTTRNSNVSAQIFPAPQQYKAERVTSVGVVAGAAAFHASARAWPCVIAFEHISDNQVRVTVAPSALEGVEDVILRIAYRGDIGQAFSGGVLIADNFSNGAIWEIGLRYLRIKDNTLIIKIIPRTPDTPAVLDPTVPQRERFTGKSVAVIDSAEAVPVYKLRFSATGATR